MIRRTIPILLGFAIALALGVTVWSPAAGAEPAGETLLSAAKKHHPERHPQAGQIACTPAGCHRISPRCHPEPDYDFWGNPTGYDKIVCSRG